MEGKCLLHDTVGPIHHDLGAKIGRGGKGPWHCGLIFEIPACDTRGFVEADGAQANFGLAHFQIDLLAHGLTGLPLAPQKDQSTILLVRGPGWGVEDQNR